MPGDFDSNGIYRIAEDDVAPTFSDLIDLLADSVSNKIATIVSDMLSGDADLDARLDELEDEHGAWETFTPSLAAGWTLGNGTLVSRYREVGKTVHVRHVLTFGTTTAIASNNTGFGHPVPALGTAHPQNTIFEGGCLFYDNSSGTQYPGWLSAFGSAGAFAMFGSGTVAATRLSSTVPVAYGQNDILSIAYKYERS